MHALAICDTDWDGKSQSVPNGDEPRLMQLLHAVCGKVHVLAPAQSCGRDLKES